MELGGALILLVVIAGFLRLVGAERSSGRLLAFPVLVALVLPLACGVFELLARDLGKVPSFSWAVAAIFAAGSIIIAVLGIVAFVNRRRALRRWMGESRTSAKRRLE